MLQNLQTAKSQFLNIPHDLKAMIFEFLPLSDYFKVQLVCRNFYYDFRENPELWAKHLYSYFLDPAINQDFLICESFLEGKPKSLDKGINFHSMISSRKIIETHFRLKFEFKTFLSKFTSSEFSDELTQEIFNILRTPAYPTPCLKKGMQTFPTNTLFQNFLTEVHFGLQGKPQFKDRRHLMVEEVMNQIKSVMFSGGMDEEQLIKLRWYLFEKDNTIKRNTEVSNAHLVGAKRISKVKNVLRNGKLHTIVDHSENFMQTKKNNKLKAFGARGIKVKGLFRNDAKSFGFGHNTEIDSVESGAYGCEEYQHLIEDFYQLIYSLLKNHCQMIFMYLKTIQEADLLLNEYIRLWGDFVLMMIDLNKTLAPFSEFLNDVYNRNCQSLPNFPEFSIWRVMIKVWLNDVYGPMAASFHTAFLSILGNVRIQDSQIKFNIMQLEKDLTHEKMQAEDAAFSTRNMLFNRFNEVLQIKTDEQARDQSLTVLKQFYQVICDLSYDEYTIFYSVCVPTKSETPKGALDVLIGNETQQLYDYCKQILVVDPSYLTSFFKEDMEIMDALFGKEMGCKTKEKQIPIFEAYLSEMFYSAINDYEESLLRNQSMQTEEESTRVSDIIISNIISLVKPQEEVRKKICENRNYKEGVSKIMSRKCPMVTSFVHFLSDLKNGLEYQYKEFEETYNERYMRGFTLIDDKYEGLFTLNRSPSCRFIKNLREEVNCGQSNGSTKESLEHVF